MGSTSIARARRQLWSLTGVFLLSFSLIFTNCSTNPATGERHLNLVSQQQEIAMGEQADSQVVQTMGIYPDKELNAYIQSIGQELAAKSERPDLPWKFQIVDDPAVNAFAIPGGFVYVTRGILPYLDNEAQLAGVMGHEIGHVTAKHSLNNMATQELAQLGVGVASILKPDWAQKYGQLAGVGLNLLFLKFSRDDESQADHLGLRYMERINEDPHQMAQVMAMLDQVSKASGGSQLPQWLETHPDPGNREEAINSELAGVQGGFSGMKVNTEQYISKLDGVIFGEDPREGYFKGSTFYHPQMKFQMNFPSGWQTQNQKQGVVAVSSGQDAAIQLTLAQGKTADQAAQAFFSQQGLTASSTRTSNVHGFRAVTGDFAAQTQQGNVQGNASFIDFNGTVFQIIGYSDPSKWGQYSSDIQNTVASFDRLTDPAALDVKPMRVKVITLPSGMTTGEIAQKYSSAISAGKLAIINQVDSTSTIPAGKKVKVVIK